MSKQMGMEVGEAAFLGIVVDHLLYSIRSERLTTSHAPEGNEDMIYAWKEIPTLLVEVAVQRFKGKWVHEHHSCVVALCCGDENATPTTFNVLKADGYYLTDTQTANPHKQHKRTIAPTGQCCEESAETILRKNIGDTLGLSPVQALAPLAPFPPTPVGTDRIPRETVGVK